MSEVVVEKSAQAEWSFGHDSYERGLLDQLLLDSRLYTNSQEFKQLLDFTVKLRNMAPFNAMWLQIQKPGINHAASARDWSQRFQRTVKEKARPLLIMWPFGPVALVYDVIDTEGADLAKDAFAFYAKGKIDEERINGFISALAKKEIRTKPYDQGDSDAGFIRRFSHAKDKKDFSKYEIGINRNHAPAMTFVTLAHELAHLYLGHLGKDQKLGAPERRKVKHRVQEIEAESVAYIVCNRNGVESRSQKYLNSYVEGQDSSESLDLYSITRAAGHIERLLDLSKSSEFINKAKT